MEEQRKPTRWGLWLVVGLGLLVFVVYPLSVGPAARLYVDGYIYPDTLVAVYRPLVVVDGLPTPFSGVMNRYINLWQPRGRQLRLVDRSIVLDLDPAVKWHLKHQN